MSNKSLISPGSLSSAFERYAPAVPTETPEPAPIPETAATEEVSKESAALRVRADNICPYCERDNCPQQMEVKICAGVQCYVCMKHRHASPIKNGI